MLLILADAEGGAEGLKILEHAAQLDPTPKPGYHLLRAACLAGIKDSAAASREEELTRQLKPVSAFDYMLLGRRQAAFARRYGHGQLATAEARKAIHSYQAAIRLDPNQLAARLLLARLYFNSQRYSEARTNLDTCIRTAPDLVGLYLFRAVITREEGAKALLRVKDEPTRAAEWQLEADDAFAAALDDYRRALEMHPGADLHYVLLVDRGGMHLQAGRLDQAIADALAAVALNEKLYHAHALLAQILERRGPSEAAIEALDRAIERQPERPELYRHRAILLVGQHQKKGSKTRAITPEQREQAIRALEQCIRREASDSPQTADDHAERGRLLFASGQTSGALAEYDAALRIVPGNVKALRLRALATTGPEAATGTKAVR